MLIRTAHSTLTEQLAERFAERIRSRLLPAGARLPSVRDCARQQGVSPYTVVAAYDQLLAQGLVESRRQRGFYVRDLTQKEASDPYGRAQAAIKSAANEERLAGPLDGPLPSGSHINATALIRGMFHQASSKPQPGAGVMPAAWLEEARFMPAALRKIVGGRALQDGALNYGEPMGDAGLRQALARRLADLNVPVRAGQIMTTVGATHALDIVSRTLLKAGDPVMV